MNGGILVMRFLHIVGGALWVGSAFFVAFFLIPALRAVGPAGGPVMQQIGGVRRLPIWMMAISWTTVLSGIGLYSWRSGGFSSEWIHSGTGMTFTVGALVGLATIFEGMLVNAPAGRRISVLAAEMQQAGGPPAPEKIAEMQRLQTRLGRASVHTAVLLVIAATLMSVARYVG